MGRIVLFTHMRLPRILKQFHEKNCTLQHKILWHKTLCPNVCCTPFWGIRSDVVAAHLMLRYVVAAHLMLRHVVAAHLMPRYVVAHILCPDMWCLHSAHLMPRYVVDDHLKPKDMANACKQFSFHPMPLLIEFHSNQHFGCHGKCFHGNQSLDIFQPLSSILIDPHTYQISWRLGHKQWQESMTIMRSVLYQLYQNWKFQLNLRAIPFEILRGVWWEKNMWGFVRKK